jgi:hypothetical protein
MSVAAFHKHHSVNENNFSFFTPDAAKATAILGNSTDAYNQEWHVPTTKEKLTTLQWTELIANALNTEVKIQKVPTFLLHLLGIFIPIVREFPEMLYQYEQDYIFDSGKFEKRFGLFATSPEVIRNSPTPLPSCAAYSPSSLPGWT